MSREQKPSNPKDVIGSSKVNLDLVPDSMVLFASLGFTEGALKYGKFNWRAAGVRLSIYISAMERHKMKFMAGEWADPVTKVPHLSSMLACIGIICDAYTSNKLTDDRPPAQPDLSRVIDASADIQKHLKELFRDHNPHHHTIMDAIFTPERGGSGPYGVVIDGDAQGNNDADGARAAAGGVQPTAGEGRDA
jgi:Domain of unknown function (DUF5664)